jgi:hypothetical protein
MKNKQTKETLLTCLADLFYKITKEKKKVGTIAPKKFINRLKKEKGKNILYTCTCIHLSKDNTKLAIMLYHFQRSLTITCNKMVN